VGRLVQRAYRDCPDLDSRDIATVRRWAQAECQTADRYARLEQDPGNEKLFEQWIQASRLAIVYNKELFLTPASRLAAAHAVTSLRAGDPAAHQRDLAELQTRYGGQSAP
jgi:hypothetical protein